jgi:capsular polysaccharide biosynthesis protein
MLTRLGIAPQNPERVSDTARLNLAIDAVLENLTVANVSDSQILEVTMASRSPKLASKIANSLVI